MNNRTGDGSTVRMTAPSGGYTSGQVVVVRSGATGMIGVVANDTAAGEEAVVHVDGEFLLPKKTGTAHAFSVGALGYWDVAEGNISSQASANVKAGIVTKAALAADTTVRIRLIPSKD